MRLSKRLHVVLLYALAACLTGCAYVAAFLGGAGAGALATTKLGAPKYGAPPPAGPFDGIFRAISSVSYWAIIGGALYVLVRFRASIFGTRMPRALKALDHTVRAVVGKATSLH